MLLDLMIKQPGNHLTVAYHKIDQLYASNVMPYVFMRNGLKEMGIYMFSTDSCEDSWFVQGELKKNTRSKLY